MVESAGEVADGGIGAEGGIGVGARAGCAGAADAADAIGGLRIGRDVVLHAAVTVGIELGEIAGALGVGLVEKHVVDIDRRRIDELLLRDDGDRRAEVLELRVDARAGQCVEGLIALVVLDDGEGGEDKGLLGFIRGGGNRGGCRGWGTLSPDEWRGEGKYGGGNRAMAAEPY